MTERPGPPPAMAIDAAPRSRFATYALLVGVVLVAAVLRFGGLGSDSLWLDEAATWLQSRGSFADLLATTAADNYPPLHNVLVFAAIRLFGEAEWALRLPSAILGSANVFAIYWVAEKLGGRVAALFAALFLTLSGFHIWYSQEARMYALLALGSTMFAAGVLGYLHEPLRVRKWFMQASGFVLLSSHPFGTLTWLVILMGTALLGYPRQRFFDLLKGQVLVAAIFLPWAVLLVRRAIIVDQPASGFRSPRPNMWRPSLGH